MYVPQLLPDFAFLPLRFFLPAFFVAFVLAWTEWTNLLSTALDPLPANGAAFRSDSGENARATAAAKTMASLSFSHL
jgi:hypothetical protein